MKSNKQQLTSQSEPLKQTASPTVLTPERIDSIIEFIGEDDLALCFDLRLLNAEGEVFQVKGTSSFTQAMRRENKGVIPKQFEDVVINILLKPLIQRFSEHIQENVENILPPVSAINPMILDDHVSSSPLDIDEQEENVTENTPADPGTIP